MGLSLPHLIVLALVVLLLFGRGKISELMGDFGRGIKSFKQGIAVYVGKGRRKLKHLILREVQRIPQFLELDTRIFDEEVHVLALQLVVGSVGQTIYLY